MKESCLKQLAEQLQANKGKGDSELTCDYMKKLKSMTDFDGKIKVDLLNYFMSELLENVINDSTFYMIDSILTKKGLWKDNDARKIRKIDEEFL